MIQANEQNKALIIALEIKERRLSVAERDVFNVNEEIAEVNNKLKDKLFISKFL